MPVFEIDPLQDPRWTPFLEMHSRSSVFHSREWLQALHRTYHHTPRAFAISSNGSTLTSALVFCEANSWLTGSKLISLPFSDHCEPLVASPSEASTLLAEVVEKTKGRFKYIEIRPRCFAPAESNMAWVSSGPYHFHVLDLQPSVEELYAHLHRDGVQRKIRRADRERVILELGRSEALLQEFYHLLLMTRRRHRLPPQPLSWFRNLVECFGTRLTIRVARVDRRPIAAVLTISHKRTLVYKYGCSDERFHNLGAMPRLFWEAIREAKADGFTEFDLGRSDENAAGLVRFKDHLGAGRTSIRYWRYPATGGQRVGLNSVLKSKKMQSLLSRLPDRLFRLAGEILYRHVG